MSAGRTRLKAMSVGQNFLSIALDYEEKIIPEYTGMLQLAIREASLWRTCLLQGRTSQNTQEPELSRGAGSDCNPPMTALESRLQEEGKHP